MVVFGNNHNQEGYADSKYSIDDGNRNVENNDG